MMTPHVERAAIVGTFPTWTQTPWNDPGLHICSLNDAYSLQGFQRADEWYELHPLNRLYFRPKHQRAVYADQVPHGFYVRPEGHIEWLKQQAASIPVWLQDEPPAGWPVNAHKFPKAELEAIFGAYWASGPSYQLAHLMARGVTELHIYGIHLATEHEYREQRPNFEQLMRAFIGREMKVVTKDKRRYYEGKDSLLVLPESCPLLTHGWQYGYQSKPAPNPVKLTMRKLQQEQGALAKRIVMLPRFADKRPMLDRLTRIDALLADCQMRLAHQPMPPIVIGA